MTIFIDTDSQNLPDAIGKCSIYYCNWRIKNFRNFENINITLDNKNVFFGMNDVGKTNFLYALRFVFDRNIRKNNLIDSDFYQKNTDVPVEIIVSIDISDLNDVDSMKLRAKVKGALLSGQNVVYIKLIAKYDSTEMMANPILYWGGDLNDLEEIKTKGVFSELDTVFNVIYIDAYVDLYNLFKKNSAILLKNDKNEDKDTLKHIDDTIVNLNKYISSLSGIKSFENRITPEYNHLKNDNIQVSVKSEIAVKGLYSNVVPYIKQDNDGELYPTSGEGRKKLLVYSIYDLLAEENTIRKINLFLIEEPENHLHRAMQIALSHKIFVDEKYKYTFLTTHSSFILSAMDKVNLIRIFNNTKVNSASSFYKVPEKYKEQRQRLNKRLSEAVFADKVLMVEGPSEELLFDKVLSYQNELYQAEGVYILQVEGVGFKQYIEILNKLNIECFVKTDNDLKKANDSSYSVLGFSRINKLVGKNVLPINSVLDNSVETKRKLYKENENALDKIRTENKIYLSKVSLEEDLDEAIPNEMKKYLQKDNAVRYLQNSKKYHMVELVDQLTRRDCEKIYNHYNFACLKDILK